MSVISKGEEKKTHYLGISRAATDTDNIGQFFAQIFCGAHFESNTNHLIRSLILKYFLNERSKKLTQ